MPVSSRSSMMRYYSISWDSGPPVTLIKRIPLDYSDSTILRGGAGGGL